MNLKVLYLSLSTHHLLHLFASLPELQARDRYAPLTMKDKQLIFTILLQAAPSPQQHVSAGHPI
jgi:hypothetical protein